MLLNIKITFPIAIREINFFQVPRLIMKNKVTPNQLYLEKLGSTQEL